MTLEERVADLEKEVDNLKARMPATMVVDKNFLKRAFAILGHTLVAYLLMAIAYGIIFAVLASIQ